MKSENDSLRVLRFRCRRAFTLHPSPFPLRHAVTLIELLITVTIIAILSAVFLGASRSAMESARAARTKTTITKIHGLLMERWASYATRRVDVDGAITTAIDQAGLSPRARGQALMDVRLIAARELMMLEMPDSWSDIILNPVGDPYLTQPRVLGAFPALLNAYRRNYERVKQKRPPNVGDNTDVIIANQGAECLYMIIMFATGDGEARTLFNQRDIGDTDDDGAPEFLDGWGRPIQFIRWPAGFAARSDLMSGDGDADHDPFDAFRRDLVNSTGPAPGSYPVNAIWIDELRNNVSAFRLVPLVYSSGPDGESDIDDLPFGGSAPPSSLDPYAVDPNTTGAVMIPFVDNFVFGFPFDKNQDGNDNSIDNIHNHLMDNR